MIDPAKYGTASEIAEAVGEPRTTLINAANRGEIAQRHGREARGQTNEEARTKAKRQVWVTTRVTGLRRQKYD